MSLEDRIKNLPPKLRLEVEDFVNFLTDQDKRMSGGFLRMEWAAALESEEKVSSLQLQKSLLK